MQLLKPVSKECVKTLGFGKYPLWLYEKFGLTWHDGIDFGPLLLFKKNRQPITAAHDGPVINYGTDKRGGLFITQKIFTGQNVVLLDYFHLKHHATQHDQFLRAGAEIATMGKTGNATDTHLHFRARILIKGKFIAIDAAPYFIN